MKSSVKINRLENLVLPTVSFTVPKLQQIHQECFKIVQASSANNKKVNECLKELQTKLQKDPSLEDVYKPAIEKCQKQLIEKVINYLDVYKPLIDYVLSYYYEVDKGNYLFYDVENDGFKPKKKKEFLDEIIDKCDESLYKVAFQKNNKIFSVVSKIHKPRVYKEGDLYYLNECKGFLHANYKPYDTYSECTKKKVKIFLDYIKEVSCGGDDKFYDCYTKYLGQVCRGIRTEVIIYKKTMEGTGKSTESDFMMQYVLGDAISINSSPEPLTSQYNKSLLGKVYVTFEELPVFGSGQWSAVSSRAKQIATSPKLDYRTLYEAPINAENVSNLVINTNCESIKDSHGRRIIIMPVNNSKMQDHDYFENIRKNCFNMKVGECFYAYMMSIDVANFYAQREFPETDAKRIAISELLPSHMKFLKFEYYLKNKAIVNKLSQDLYNEYCYFCPLQNIKHTQTKNNFYRDLKADMKIEPKKSGVMKYNVTFEELKDLATRFKWLCQYDEFTVEEEDDEDDVVVVKPDYKALYLEMKQKYEGK